MTAFITILSAVSQISSLGLVDLVGSRLNGRKAEPVRTNKPSTTLIVSRLLAIGGALWAGYSAINPMINGFDRLGDIPPLAMASIAFAFIKAFWRYRTSQSVA